MARHIFTLHAVHESLNCYSPGGKNILSFAIRVTLLKGARATFPPALLQQNVLRFVDFGRNVGGAPVVRVILQHQLLVNFPNSLPIGRRVNIQYLVGLRLGHVPLKPPHIIF